MSLWIDVLNRLRHDAAPGRLVAAQVEAATVIADALRSHDIVNLHGPPGNGKTYLGWVLARATGARHVASPERVQTIPAPEPGWRGARSIAGADAWTQANLADVVVVDNCPAARLEARRVVDDARWVGYRRVVLVTREPIPDHVRRVPLVLERADTDAVVRSLLESGWPVRGDHAEASLLWDRVWGGAVARIVATGHATLANRTSTHV